MFNQFDLLAQPIDNQTAMAATKKQNQASNQKEQSDDQAHAVTEMTERFVGQFDACSEYHRRGDSNSYLRMYNEALHTAIVLQRQDQSKNTAVVSGIFAENRPPSPSLSALTGPVNLHEANRQKRLLLDFIYTSATNLISPTRLEEAKRACEAVFKRDFLWNFRDISLLNHRIKPGMIYRTATLTLIQNEDFFEGFLLEKKIKTVVDLRSESEVSEKNYTDQSLGLFTRIATPIDHLSLSTWSRNIYNREATTEEIYRFFAMEATGEVKEALEGILKVSDAVAIHCHSGKDRTGFLVTLLHLLSGAELDVVYADYLASERDTKKENLDVILGIIEEKNGIENYLLFCGLNSHQISELRRKLVAA